MTFFKPFIQRSILTFLGIALGRTLMPDERLDRLLGRTPKTNEPRSAQGGYNTEGSDMSECKPMLPNLAPRTSKDSWEPISR